MTHYDRLADIFADLRDLFHMAAGGVPMPKEKAALMARNCDEAIEHVRTLAAMHASADAEHLSQVARGAKMMHAMAVKLGTWLLEVSAGKATLGPAAAFELAGLVENLRTETEQLLDQVQLAKGEKPSPPARVM